MTACALCAFVVWFGARSGDRQRPPVARQRYIHITDLHTGKFQLDDHAVIRFVDVRCGLPKAAHVERVFQKRHQRFLSEPLHIKIHLLKQVAVISPGHRQVSSL